MTAIKNVDASKPGIGHNSVALLLDGVSDAALNHGMSAKVNAVAIKAAWPKCEEDAIKYAFHISYMIGRYGVTKEKAIEAFGRAWPTKKNKGGAGVMNTAQHKLMNGAKSAYNRAVDEAAVKAKNPNKVKAKNKNADGETFANVEKLVVPKGAPKVANTVDYAAYCVASASACVNLKLHNEAHKAFAGKMAAEVYNATKDHLDCLKAIIAKYDETPAA